MASLSSTANVVLVQGTLFLLIAGMAGTTDINGLFAQLTNLRGIATGFGCQFFLLPLLGFISVMVFQLEPLYGIMLLLTTTSPGGGFSGFWCSICNADIALSIAMTTVSTFASIVMLPANVFLYVTIVYGTSVRLDFVGIGISIAVVISAIFTGVLLGTLWPTKKTLFNRLGSFGGMSNIFLALYSAFVSSGNPTAAEVDPEADDGFELPPPTWYVAVASPCLLGLLISLSIARAIKCTKPESVAICIECCFQNTGIANSVALTIFSGRDASRALLVPLFYGLTEIVVLSVFGFVAWQLNWTYAQRTENFLACVGGNHQPEVVDMGSRQAPEWVMRLRERIESMSSQMRKGDERPSGAQQATVMPAPLPAAVEEGTPADDGNKDERTAGEGGAAAAEGAGSVSNASIHPFSGSDESAPTTASSIQPAPLPGDTDRPASEGPSALTPVEPRHITAR